MGMGYNSIYFLVLLVHTANNYVLYYFIFSNFFESKTHTKENDI